MIHQTTQAVITAALVSFALTLGVPAWAEPDNLWQRLWPDTDFSKHLVPLSEVQPGGPGKDGIPAIDQPQFVPLNEASNLADDEPVIGVVIAEQAKAYPLRILIWHEIANDRLSGVPIAVTYCPLCNTSIVFERRVGHRVLDFGTTGNLRHSDLVMYDRQTESWWQQYSGRAIIGELVGVTLTVIPSRLESMQNFRQRNPDGLVLVPNNPNARNYGANPYVGYDRASLPFLYDGLTPPGVAPMMRVVAIGDIAFTLPLVRSKGVLQQADWTITWQAGQSSALDNARLSHGADVGNIVVTQQGEDIPYMVTFAFAFFAFNPDGVLYTEDGEVRPGSSAPGNKL